MASVGVKETGEKKIGIKFEYGYPTKYGEKFKFSAIQTTNYIDKLFFSLFIFSFSLTYSLHPSQNEHWCSRFGDT